MEAQDVLREQVPNRRPERRDEILARSRVRERAQVVDERVRPHVGDRIRIPRDRDPPRLPCTADREVLQPSLDEAPRLVGPESRLDEVAALEQLEQLLLERREPEEPVPLLDPLRLPVVLGALSVDEVGLGLERLAADAVQPRVHVLVDVPVVVEPLQESLDERLVLRVARADEEVVRRIEALGELTPDDRDLIGVLLRRQPLLRGDPGHLRGVLVDPGQEERLGATLALVAGQDVRRDRRVGVPDVRGRVHVVDRRRDVVALHDDRFYGGAPAAPLPRTRSQEGQEQGRAGRRAIEAAVPAYSQGHPTPGSRQPPRVSSGPSRWHARPNATMRVRLHESRHEQRAGIFTPGGRPVAADVVAAPVGACRATSEQRPLRARSRDAGASVSRSGWTDERARPGASRTTAPPGRG